MGETAGKREAIKTAQYGSGQPLFIFNSAKQPETLKATTQSVTHRRTMRHTLSRCHCGPTLFSLSFSTPGTMVDLF